MTTPYADGNGPSIPMPELTLPALRQAVATVAPSRLPEFFDDLQKAFVRAGDEDSVVPIRMFYLLPAHPRPAARTGAASKPAHAD
ncbi:hypothetical protein [Streptomyces guryensis]|uniref:Uncharacterized protein n=1 Tax=Streptomyces guryensis TaxID=2886947 RepID=A0A9Q3VR93_9ACTN|nr:hypothetical protein [Streptomyces guryensis]MCD9875736.1 hypothetical protein [Streptomyces guryensis]